MLTNISEGFVWWFTGRPASGKTTLATRVQHTLAERGIHTQLLDSDELRKVLTPQPIYSERERDWFYATLRYIATMLAQNGVNVLIAATATKRCYRDLTSLSHFAEIYVDTNVEICARRDPKGLYARSAVGDVATLPGVGVAYEPPLGPAVRVDGEQSADLNTQIILTQLLNQGMQPQQFYTDFCTNNLSLKRQRF